jgi:hypothetical protein
LTVIISNYEQFADVVRAVAAQTWPVADPPMTPQEVARSARLFVAHRHRLVALSQFPLCSESDRSAAVPQLT